MHSQLVPRGSPLSISLPIPGGNITSRRRKELLLQSFEPQSLPTRPSTCQKPDTPQSHNALKCNVLIVAAFLLLNSLLAVLQTTILIVLAYMLPRSCTTNGTQMNSSDCAQTAAESEKGSIYFRVIGVLYVTFSFSQSSKLEW